METLSEVNQRCLALKLEVLEKQRGLMCNAVDAYVNKVISAGRQWAESENTQRPQFLEMFQKIDSAVEFLYLKHTELSAESDNYSLQTSTKNIVTRQNDADGRSEQVLSQETDVETTVSNVPSNFWKRFDQNEMQVKKITAKLDKVDNLGSELQNLKQELQKLSANQDNKLQNLKQELQTLIANQENKLQNMKKGVTKTSKKQDIKLQNLSEELQTLSATLQDEIDTKINEDLENNHVVTSNEIEVMKSSVMSAIDKNNSLLEVLSSRTEELETVTAELSEKLSTSDETFETFLTKEENCAVAIEEIQGRLTQVEAGDTIYLQVLQMKLEEFEANSNILCQMLANRLQPLEQLRQVLNERSKDRDENVTKLHEIVKEVTAMTPRIAELEKLSSRPVIGFSAASLSAQTVSKNSVITDYFNIQYNEGSHFNPKSGEFTAPLDGVYAVSVSVTCQKDHFLEVCLKRGSDANLSLQFVFQLPIVTRTCACHLIRMKACEKLYTAVSDKSESNERQARINFSCFRIG